jgi:DNA-binding MarR family transcriptional regulator
MTAASTTDIDLTARLRNAVARLSRQLRQQSNHGLTVTQLTTLAALEQQGGPMTLGALAESEKVAPPTMTKVVAKLEDDGLVLRSTDANDRRVARVTLTRDGAEVLAEVRAERNAWLAARLDELPAADQRDLQRLVGLLERLVGGAPE